jgi:hypothetical protein
MLDCADRLALKDNEGNLIEEGMKIIKTQLAEGKLKLQLPLTIVMTKEQERAIGDQDRYEFWMGRKVQRRHVSEIWEDELDERKEMDVLKQCGMRDEFLCRHCHEEECQVRLAPRRY